MSVRAVAVFDCTVFLQAMLSANGADACWQKVVAGEVTLLVAPFILAAMRRLPGHGKLLRFSRFTPERVERFIEELLEVAELVADPPAQFNYPRDPDDAPYVDLAVTTGALLIVSSDKDLLVLMDDANPEGRAVRCVHPTFQVLTPSQFLHALDQRPSA